MGFLCSVVDGSFNGRTSLFKFLLIPKTSKQIKQNKQTSKQTIKQPPKKITPQTSNQTNTKKETNK
jgi:hypothetical protein